MEELSCSSDRILQVVEVLNLRSSTQEATQKKHDCFVIQMTN